MRTARVSADASVDVGRTSAVALGGVEARSRCSGVWWWVAGNETCWVRAALTVAPAWLTPDTVARWVETRVGPPKVTRSTATRAAVRAAAVLRAAGLENIWRVYVR